MALAVADGLMTRVDAETDIMKLFPSIGGRAERNAVIAALGAAGATQPGELIDAVIKSDPGHAGPSPPGPPPRPGLVWNPVTHRWILAPVPTAPPPPAPSVLNKGANVISGKAAGAPAHYQPPPPKLPTNVGQYGASGSTAASGIPPTIDHTLVGAFPQAESSLPKDYKDGGRTSGTIVTDHLHTTSGYRVQATWKWGGVATTGAPRNYTIKVLDGSGSVVSTYDSAAPRDEAYVKGRAVQVAHWLDGEVKKLAAQKGSASTTAPLAQFAWDYAQAAGVKPGQVPFDIASTGTDPKDRAKVEGFLKAQFPNLIGAQQHKPHGGMDTIEHTMNIVHPANLRTAGLPQRDAEILRLGMVFHDVGKQYDPKDHEHPRKSAKDAEPMLWQFGLSEREVSDTLAVIKWHDAYGDAMQAGSKPSDVATVAKIAYEYTDASLPPLQRQVEALRINDLLMRAWQSDLASIPGLTSKPVPGRPDIKVSGFIDVDTAGPAFKAKVDAEIYQMQKSGALPKSAPVPKKPPAPPTGPTPQPSLVAPGLKWGELVQRTDKIPVGQPVPYDSTVVPPKEVYDEAHKNPDLNYARAFNMGYDGPTGKIVSGFHGTSGSHNPSILQNGIWPGDNGDNYYGHGVYVFVNGASEMTSYYTNNDIVHMEIHTGRVVEYKDLINKILPKWEKANPAEAKKMRSDHKLSGKNAHYTAAALWAGYSTVATPYTNSSNEPILIVLDPSRIRTRGIVGSRGGGYKGKTVKTPTGNVKFPGLTPEEIKVPKSDPLHIPVKGQMPQGWTGTPRTT